jgi:hypothetical protein
LKAETQQIANEVQFIVTDVPEDIGQKLADDYYVRQADRFVRSYPLSSPHIDQIAQSFVLNADRYISQAYGNAPVPWNNALKSFINRLRDLDIEWLLIGSCPLAIRGIDVAPRGVDLVCRMKDFELVQETLVDCTVLPFEACENWVAKAFGVAFLGAPISIAFEPQDCLDQPDPIDSGPYAMAHAETILWEGYQLPVPPIQLSININRKRERTERVALIEAFMK